MKNENIKKILDLQLKDYTLLPEINDEKIVIIFDIVKGEISESPMDIVLYYKGNEIWREPVFFENPELCFLEMMGWPLFDGFAG